jgi:hypothetical protein
LLEGGVHNHGEEKQVAYRGKAFWGNPGFGEKMGVGISRENQLE